MMGLYVEGEREGKMKRNVNVNIKYLITILIYEERERIGHRVNDDLCQRSKLAP